MKRLVLFIFAFILLISSAYAVDISGIVVDNSDKTPLPNANIFITELGIGTTTDSDGRFSFDNIDSGEYTIGITYIGYTEEAININSDMGISIELGDIELNPRVLEMAAVTIVGELGHISITGRILDQNNEAVDEALVSIKGTNVAGKYLEFTDRTLLGFYFIPFVNSGNYQLTISVQGIETKIIDVELDYDISNFPTIDVIVEKLPGIEVSEEDIVVDECNGDYDYLIVENGNKILNTNDFNDLYYTLLTYEIDGEVLDSRDNMYYFEQPGLGDKIVHVDGETRVLLYRYDAGNCGEYTVDIRDGKCTQHLFVTNKGNIPFLICPESTSVQPTPQEDTIECTNTKGDTYLITESGETIENPLIKLGGGICYTQQTGERKDRVKDGSTIGYFTCEDNCQVEHEYTCPNGAINVETENYADVGICEISDDECPATCIDFDETVFGYSDARNQIVQLYLGSSVSYKANKEEPAIFYEDKCDPTRENWIIEQTCDGCKRKEVKVACDNFVNNGICKNIRSSLGVKLGACVEDMSNAGMAISYPKKLKKGESGEIFIQENTQDLDASTIFQVSARIYYKGSQEFDYFSTNIFIDEIELEPNTYLSTYGNKDRWVGNLDTSNMGQGIYEIILIFEYEDHHRGVGYFTKTYDPKFTIEKNIRITKENVLFTVYDDKFTIIFVPVDWDKSEEEYSESVDNQYQLFVDSYPLNECIEKVDKIVVDTDHSCNFGLDSMINKQFAGFELRDCIEKNLDIIPGLTLDYNVAVGVFPQTTLDGGSSGFRWRGRREIFASYVSPFILSHEMGHLYGLAEEYLYN